jgi:hypothetical protein
MMAFRSAFLTGFAAAVVSSAGAVFYAWKFNTGLFDYSYLLGYASIAAACVFVCIFAAIMFWAAVSVIRSWGEAVFSLVFAFGSMASIYYPLNASVDDRHGFFAVYALPLHFFPVLAWFAAKPFIYRKAC